jgi:hypothetical protein
LTLLSINLERDVAESYWQARHVRDSLQDQFLIIKSQEGFWNYYANVFGPELFSDLDSDDLAA